MDDHGPRPCTHEYAHATSSAYLWHRCRCDECRAWWRAYRRAHRTASGFTNVRCERCGYAGTSHSPSKRRPAACERAVVRCARCGGWRSQTALGAVCGSCRVDALTAGEFEWTSWDERQRELHALHEGARTLTAIRRELR